MHSEFSVSLPRLQVQSFISLPTLEFGNFWQREEQIEGDARYAGRGEEKYFLILKVVKASESSGRK